MLTTNGLIVCRAFILGLRRIRQLEPDAACCLNVVVTSRKITSTINTSINATMMTAGVLRRLRTRNRMVNAFYRRRIAAG